MKITLKQFKKFADENDILWHYNKPRLCLIPPGRRSGKRHIREQLREVWLEGNWHEAQFGTPKEREEERGILQNKKERKQ